MLRQSLLRQVFRLLIVYLILAAMFLVWGEYFVKLLIPLFRWTLESLAPEFRVLKLEAMAATGTLHAHLQVIPTGPLVVGGQILYEDSAIWPMTVSTPFSQTYQTPLTLLTAALAWPISSMRRRLGLLAITITLTCILTVLDIPLVLLGSVWLGLIDNFAPGTESLLGEIPGWISDGGRLAVCLAASMLAIGISQLIPVRMSRQ